MQQSTFLEYNVLFATLHSNPCLEESDMNSASENLNPNGSNIWVLLGQSATNYLGHKIRWLKSMDIFGGSLAMKYLCKNRSSLNN